MADAWDQFPDPPKPQTESDPWSQFPDQDLSWSDVPGQAIKNLPSSAYNLAAGIANTVMHPIDTAQGIYDVGKGAVSKAAGALGVEQDPAAKAQNEAAINAVGEFFANRYGSLENFKKTLAEDPAGFAMDLSTVLTGGQAALARVPGATRAATRVGQVAEAANPVRMVGNVASGVRVPGTGIKAGIEPVVSTALGMTTGVGEGPIRQAARAGYEGNTALRENMRGMAPMTRVIDQATSAVDKMGADRSAAYRASMATANAAPGHVGYQPIHQALADADKMVNFQGLAKSSEAAKTLEQIQDIVGQWRGLNNPNTVEAADALKQAIGEIRQKTQPGTLERRVADSVYNATKGAIVQQAPEYASAMKNYADASEKIDELRRTFSLNEKASIDTTLRKLQSTQRNNVQANYGHRNALLEELAKYEPDVPYALAGQSLNTATPRGLTSQLTAKGLGLSGGGMIAGNAAGVAINPLMLMATGATLPFFSPRLVGEAAYAGGRVARVAEPIISEIPNAALLGYNANTLRGGSGPRYDENGNSRFR